MEAARTLERKTKSGQNQEGRTPIAETKVLLVTVPDEKRATAEFLQAYYKSKPYMEIKVVELLELMDKPECKCAVSLFLKGTGTMWIPCRGHLKSGKEKGFCWQHSGGRVVTVETKEEIERNWVREWGQTHKRNRKEDAAGAIGRKPIGLTDLGIESLEAHGEAHREASGNEVTIITTIFPDGRVTVDRKPGC